MFSFIFRHCDRGEQHGEWPGAGNMAFDAPSGCPGVGGIWWLFPDSCIVALHLTEASLLQTKQALQVSVSSSKQRTKSSVGLDT